MVPPAAKQGGGVREQHYMTVIKPEYNILKSAGSILGFKHSEESKLKMSNSKKGFKHTEETKAKISKNMIHSEESKEKLRSYRHTEEALASRAAPPQRGRDASLPNPLALPSPYLVGGKIEGVWGDAKIRASSSSLPWREGR